MQLTVTALSDIGRVSPGDWLPQTIVNAIERSGIEPAHGDICAVSSKIVSKAEGRFVALSDVKVTDEAQSLATRCNKDARLVQCVLDESTHISRVAPNVIITRHRLGFISANAAIDASNVGETDTVLLMPENPADSARRILDAIVQRFGVHVPVVITDSHGRPFRYGTVGVAIACVGMDALIDERGRMDLYGRALETTETAFADQVATAADLVAGQGAEGRPVVWLRGLEPRRQSTQSGVNPDSISQLLRPAELDLYA